MPPGLRKPSPKPPPPARYDGDDLVRQCRALIEEWEAEARFYTETPEAMRGSAYRVSALRMTAGQLRRLVYAPVEED